MIEAKDIRGGLPSASSMDNDLRCPARRRLMEHFNLKEEEEDKPEADLGTLIHKVLAGESKMEDLNESGKILTERIMQQEAKLIDKYGFESFESDHREIRLWLSEELESVASGQPDRFLISGYDSLLINYKTGYAAGIPITENYQIKFEAAMVAYYYPITRVYGNLIHPNYGSNPVESITYEKDDLIDWLDNVVFPILKVIKSGKGLPTPGFYQCRYCPVGKVGKCPALNEKNKGAISSAGKDLLPIEDLTPDKRGERLQLLKELESFIKNERERTKENILNDPAYVTGWCMRSLGSTKSIKKFGEAREILKNWLSNMDIDECVTLSIPKAINRVAKKMGTSAAAAKAILMKDMKNVIVFSPKQPSLVPSDSPEETEED